MMGGGATRWRSTLCLLTAVLCMNLFQDGEGVGIAFGQDDYTQMENLGPVSIEILKEEVNLGEVIVTVTPVTFQQFFDDGGTLPAPLQGTVIDPAEFELGPDGRMDFDNAPVQVTFQPNVGFEEQIISIEFVDDIVNEDDEGFLLMLEAVSSDPADTVTLTRSVALVRITDNDQIFLQFVQPNYIVDEGDGTIDNVVFVEKQNGAESEQVLEVLLSYQDQTTGPNIPFVFPDTTFGEADDFIPGPEVSLIFNPDDAALAISFEIIDDDILEEQEEFVINLAIPGQPPVGLLLGMQPTATVSINDNDVGIISFTQSSISVQEDSGTMVARIELISPMLFSPFLFAGIEITISPDTATDLDYQVTASQITSSVDGFIRFQEIEFTIIDDNLEEDRESFSMSLTLRPPDEVIGVFDIDISRLDVFIIDNDRVVTDNIFIVPFPTIIGFEGLNIQITCGPSGPEPLEISASGNLLLVTDLEGPDNSTFEFGPLDRSDEGTEFICIRGSLESNISILTVLYRPEYTFELVYEGIEEQPLLITLGLDGNTLDFPSPDTFEWFLNGQLLSGSSNIILTENTIEFVSLDRANAGEYTVVATNQAGSGNATFQVIVFYPPQYTFELVYEGIEEQPLLITLGLDGNTLDFPSPDTFEWFLNGQLLSGSSNIILTENTIEFVSLDRANAGEYTVVATNQAGSGNATFQVIVFYPPQYTFELVYEGIEEQPLLITLGLDGNTLDFPSPDTFEWFLNGQQLSGSSNIILTENTIEFVSLDRANAGEYTVVATNQAGSGNATFQVVVFYAPQYTVNDTFVFQEGDFVSIQLILEAFPLPGPDNFTWAFNGAILTELGGLTLGVDSIVFDMVTRMDSGNYTVQSSNIAGSGEGSFQLQVEIPATTQPPTTGTETTPTDTTGTETTPTDTETTPTDTTGTETTPTDTTGTETTSPDPITATATPSTTTDGSDGVMRGDPHFEVLVPSGQRLCFTVQGEHGFTFNIISNKIMHMNAKFIPDSRREEVTWIGSLGLVVRSKLSNTTTKIRFEADEKMVYVDNKMTLKANKINSLVFYKGKLSISEAPRVEKNRYPEVVVDLQDVGLTFTVMFIREHLDVKWTRVRQQPRDSHGVVGQFFRSGVEIDEIRHLLLLPTMEPVPVMRKPAWHFMEREEAENKMCWVAMNPGYQGKQLLEGHYLDYLVNDVFSTKFKFSPVHKKLKLP